MVDVVANHMGYPPGCPGCSMSQETNFGGLSPFNHGEHYHNYCDINNWGDQNEVENCRLAQLPDLNQQNSYVRSTLKNWISNLVKEYGFDGIRIDTIPEVPKDFWSEFGQAAGVFQIGEVDNGNPAYVGPYQGPITATLHYPMYWVLRHVFAEKTSGMKDISNALQGYPSNFKDTSVLGGFVDNHDNPRFLNLNSDWTALTNALTYTIMAQWIPIIYYGTEQAYNGGNDPDNRLSLWPNFNTNHMMYKFISQVNHFRNGLGNDFFEAKQLEKWADDTFYAFTRGNVLVALTNQGSGSTQQRTIPNLPFSDGTVLQNVLDENDKVTANQGKISVSIQNGQPKIYHPMSNQVVTASPKSTARSGSAPSATKRSPSSQNGQHPLEDGSVAGLVVGSVIGAMMVVGVAGFLVYKLKYKKNSYENI